MSHDSRLRQQRHESLPICLCISTSDAAVDASRKRKDAIPSSLHKHHGTLTSCQHSLGSCATIFSRSSSESKNIHFTVVFSAQQSTYIIPKPYRNTINQITTKPNPPLPEIGSIDSQTPSFSSYAQHHSHDNTRHYHHSSQRPIMAFFITNKSFS